VHCSDFEDYVCKHDQAKSKLFNEYLCANLLRIWGIPFPVWDLIQIKEEHVTEHAKSQGVHPINFKTVCFGTRHLSRAQEITKLFHPLIATQNAQRRIANPIDFLNIGLFDLWLANEDRSHNNSNLLLNPTTQGDVIMPIDHSDIFNTRSLFAGRELAQLTDSDSILLAGYTHHVAKLSKAKRRIVIDKLVENFYICVSDCDQEVERIVLNAPANWNLPLDEYLYLIRNQIITNQSWLAETIENFKRCVHLAYA
jgi:hypothetical protein